MSFGDDTLDPGNEFTVIPGDDPQPAFPPRAAQRIERTDREILIDIQERLVRMESLFTTGAQAMEVIRDAVAREGLIGMAKAIPAMIQMAATLRTDNDDGN